MKIQERNAITGILLSLVTCGIYAIYWAFCQGREAASVKDAEADSMVDGILCALIPFVGYYLVEKKFTEGCAAKGIAHNDNSIMYLILGLILPIANLYLMQNELNALAEK